MANPSVAHDRSLRDLLNRLSGTWTIPILSALADGPRRFMELRRSMPIAANGLTRGLRSLERDGLICRRTWPSGRIHVDYELTPLGRRYLGRIRAVERWAAEDAAAAGLSRPARGVRGRGGTAVREPGPLRADPSVWTALGAARLMHVSLAVRDIDRSARAFAELFRLPLPPLRAGRIAHGSSVGDLLICSFQLPNFFIEFVQHLDGVTPYGEFTRRHGDSFHHLAFHVGGQGFGKRIEWLEQHGGLCVAGGVDAHYADIDLQAQLGATVELLAADDLGDDWNTVRSSPPDADDGSNIGNQQVTHVGVVVQDVQRVARAYATIFGVEPPAVRTCTPRFARGARVASGAYAKVASIRQPNVAIQVIEPVGRSPLRDYLEEHGNSVHHIGLNLRDRLDDTVSHMEECGGRRILGREGDPYAQMDFRSPLGFVVELTGISRRTQPAR